MRRRDFLKGGLQTDGVIVAGQPGWRARTFARIDNLLWDIASRTMEATIISLRDQDITLAVWHAIADEHRVKRTSGAALNWNEASI